MLLAEFDFTLLPFDFELMPDLCQSNYPSNFNILIL